MNEVVGRCPVCEAAIRGAGSLRWRTCDCRIPRSLTVEGWEFALSWDEDTCGLTASCGSFAAHGRTLAEVRELCQGWVARAADLLAECEEAR